MTNEPDAALPARGAGRTSKAKRPRAKGARTRTVAALPDSARVVGPGPAAAPEHRTAQQRGQQGAWGHAAEKRRWLDGRQQLGSEGALWCCSHRLCVAVLCDRGAALSLRSLQWIYTESPADKASRARGGCAELENLT